MKHCKRCQEDYPHTKEYWGDSSKKKGYCLNQCRVCSRSYINKNHRSIKGQYSALKSSAKSNSLAMEISLKQFINLRKNTCTYCNDTLPEVGYGIDRKDNLKGYTLENSIPCCTMCNTAKRHHSIQEFAEWVNRVSIWAKGAI